MPQLDTILTILSVLPFAGLLLMVATGPVLYPHFWHRYYAAISCVLGGSVMGYYAFALGEYDVPVETLAEYIQFITLIGALYVASGAIRVVLPGRGTPSKNLMLLWSGALLSNFIGTTGASMLLIRPYMRFNKGRLAAYHVVFFIFMVSNVGGALTPIGDPPLFLGFLKGVPFFWTLTAAWQPWLLAMLLLGLLFYWWDATHLKKAVAADRAEDEPGFSIDGGGHLIFLLLIIGAVFLDPKLVSWVPSLSYHGHQFSFLRELLLVGIGLAAYWSADKKVLRANSFTMEPLREVASLFIGIFGTMVPALALVASFAKSPTGQAWLTPHTLYWGTGLLSSVLDNAPTYLNFLAAGMASHGLNLQVASDVAAYATWAETYAQLLATSIAAVFFGAMTYVGNGPNFMVRAIAEEEGVEMPSFGGYIVRYSLPYLLPVLGLVWVVFFYFGS